MPGAPVCVKNCNTAGVFCAPLFPVCIKGLSPKGHPDNLTQLWEALESTTDSIPVERYQHCVESMPLELNLFLGHNGVVQLNVRKLFLMFCVLSVCI